MLEGRVAAVTGAGERAGTRHGARLAGEEALHARRDTDVDETRI